ncbi:glutaminase A [Chitinophaga barathri]|uniref:Glutaminase n=1 Tax=Chitinophaga barathri TaxID=1647451 RepID=A0A3N4MMT4_9BACT|nr:glutaminase A [Chitinophaga barathri]RPD41360.1 glutaminase [Chitinophaga barathri]
MKRLAILLFSTLLITVTSFAQNYNELLKETHEKFKGLNGGANADYIPFLANVPSNLFGISIVTADGKVFEAGDTKYEFGIESISKAFVLCKAMMEVGPDSIAHAIGVNATGMPFNSVIAIELEGYSPVSPLVNAGAMATNSMIKGPNKDAQWQIVLNHLSDMAGRPLKVLDELYKSEAATNQHNRAIAMLLDAYGHMWADPIDACDSYTKQCSVGVTAKDLAVMAGVLANGGVNPITKKRILDEKYVPKILAVMSMEGLYQTSGTWLFHVGLPGKSGVGGGVIAVVPGRMAIAAFSPPLDPVGNSVRSMAAINYISEKLNLNLYSSSSKK